MCIRDRAYWAQAIEPGTATGLLLDGISRQKEPGDNWYYGINVVGQFATMGDWGTAEGSDGFFGENDGPAPVSYTHLDVYKRQAAG